MSTAISKQPANGLAVENPQHRSLIEAMAEQYGLEPLAFFEAVKATVFNNKGTKEEMIAFLVVAKHYDLNPFIKEIYAFPKQGGGIQPIVPVDGWTKIINRNPQFDGMTFQDEFDEEGKLASVTCQMHRKDRQHPVECTEYMVECKRGTDPWRQWPRRMLRHKAMIQAARYAFSLSGIMDPDEAERAESVGWSQTPQSKVGISGVNKMLDAMPAHKPQESHHDAQEGVDDIPDDVGNQEPPAATECSQEAYLTFESRIAETDTPLGLNQIAAEIKAVTMSANQRKALDGMVNQRKKELK